MVLMMLLGELEKLLGTPSRTPFPFLPLPAWSLTVCLSVSLGLAC